MSDLDELAAAVPSYRRCRRDPQAIVPWSAVILSAGVVAFVLVAIAIIAQHARSTDYTAADAHPPPRLPLFEVPPPDTDPATIQSEPRPMGMTPGQAASTLAYRGFVGSRVPYVVPDQRVYVSGYYRNGHYVHGYYRR